MSGADMPTEPDRGGAKERLLDLFVFAPVGMALTLVEELPSLVEKGRNRIEGRSATARVVGQFAVQIGSREVSRRVRQVLEAEEPKPVRSPRPAAPVRAADKSGLPSPAHGHGHGTLSHAPRADVDRADVDRADVDRAEVDTAEVDTAEVDIDTSRSSNGQARVGDLAIPAYDTLSASQVVKLLAGLSHDELIEVESHERSNRHRATILNRVEQLLSGEPSLEAP